MRPTLSEFEELAGEAFDQATAGIDADTIESLNLGVAVAREENRQRDPDGGVSYTLGTFVHHPILGRQVELYYGSFLAVHGSLQLREWQEEIESVVRHELQHFLEDLQGRRDLAKAEEEERRFRRMLGPANRPATWWDAGLQLARPIVVVLVILGVAFLLARLIAG